MDYAKALLQDGVAVIPAFTQEDIKIYHTAFWETVRGFPEYINPADPSNIFVGSLASDGALSNPASFHNPVVRHLRINMMFRAVPLFSELNRLTSRELNLEQLIDRMSIRRQGTTLSKETWHRKTLFLAVG